MAISSTHAFSQTTKAEPEKIAVSAGDINIIVTDEDGKAIEGAKIRLFLPGKDGSLKKMPNDLFEIVDGDKNDQDKEKNGAVLLTAKMVSKSIGKKGEYKLEVNFNKYVERDEKGGYSADKPNEISVILKKNITKEPTEKKSDK
ncbi:MAG: hypothetical protein WCX65_16880 [bacterium]